MNEDDLNRLNASGDLNGANNQRIPAGPSSVNQPIPSVTAGGQNQFRPSGGLGNQGSRPTESSNQDELLPTEAEIEAITSDVESNSVAPKATIREILDALQAKRQNATPKDLFSLAWACYHNGSSRFVNLNTDAPCGITHAELKDLVEGFCTLRQFCSYYAKSCYVSGKQQKKPPANWSRKGYPEEAKFAGFDFFNAVLSESSPAPPGGMRFKPTQAEILGHSMNAKMSIVESRQSSHMVSTRADLLGRQQINEQPKPPMITF
uniref:Capsid protein n=1 Tax=Shallot virus X TaxID=31770 RepID=A0A8F8N4I5_SHVX|nr:capsid protein [Shallot virus X]